MHRVILFAVFALFIQTQYSAGQLVATPTANVSVQTSPSLGDSDGDSRSPTVDIAVSVTDRGSQGIASAFVHSRQGQNGYLLAKSVVQGSGGANVIGSSTGARLSGSVRVPVGQTATVAVVNWNSSVDVGTGELQKTLVTSIPGSGRDVDWRDFGLFASNSSAHGLTLISPQNELETAFSALYWAVGDPGPSGYGHLPGVNPDDPITAPDPMPVVPTVIYRQPEGGGVRALNGNPQPVNQAFAAAPSFLGYGLNNPVYFGGTRSNTIVSTSVAASRSAASEIIAYEVAAPDVGIASFELARVTTIDNIYSMLVDGDVYSVSAGETVDFINLVGHSVESFFLFDIDDTLRQGDDTPFTAGLTFGGEGGAEVFISALVRQVPEPGAAIMAMAFITCSACCRRNW